MKDGVSILCFGAGLVVGMLLYKHSDETKKIVNKTEKAISNGVEDVKEKVSPKNQKSKKSN